MNEALKIYPTSDFDVASLAMMRRIRGAAAAANEDGCVDVPVIEAWAHRASEANGFGAALASLPSTASRPTAHELHEGARMARARGIAEVIASAVASMRKALGGTLARYRAYRDARETMQVLRGLDDRTLHDLGYDRSEIESVALEVSIARAR